MGGAEPPQCVSRCCGRSCGCQLHQHHSLAPHRHPPPQPQPHPHPYPAPPAAAGVLSALESSRDGLAKRVEGLVKCKNEFSELARCL